MTRGVRVFLCCVAVLLLVGCRTTVEVDIRSDATAGGEIHVVVRLDAEAVEALGGSDVIKVDDLVRTNWVVSAGPTGDGGYRLEAHRTFVDARDLQAGLDELTGPGVFSDVSSVVEHGFARTDSELSVAASFTGDLAQFSDDALTETLGGLPLGYTPEELADIGATEPGAATLRLRVQAPGGKPDEATLELSSGEPQSVSVTSTGSERDDAVVLLGAGGAALVLVGVVLSAVVLVRRRRNGPGGSVTTLI